MDTSSDTQPQIIWINAVFILLTPVLAVGLGAWSLLTQPQTAAPFILAIVLWWVTGIGITAGYHRLFSHRSYKAAWPLRLFFAIAGAATWQNHIIAWCSNHRRHHRFVDTDKDPYNAKRGFWWSHMGWVLYRNPYFEDFSNVKDLIDDPICAWQERHYMKISIAFNVGVPLVAGLLTNNVLGMLLWAGLVRVVLVHHATFLINSVAHIAGSQPWSRHNTSRDSWWLALLTFGEGYHNYHHAFEADYRNGYKWYTFDPSKWLIWLFSHIKVTSNLRRIPWDMIEKKRYEERRSVLDSKRTQWAEWVEEFKADISVKATETHTTIQTHLSHVEARIDERLRDLRSTRTQLQDALRNKGTVTRREIKLLKTQMSQTRHALRASIREWEQLIAQYGTMMDSAAASA